MKKRGRSQKTSFDADPQTLKSLKVVTAALGFGNQSMGIRRAIVLAAELFQSGMLADWTRVSLASKADHID